jgi:glycosyltransferase involved in cell wall biosynthesis
MTSATPADDARPWHLLTGEYPPQTGGVSDYTMLVAAGLAEIGREVHVWTVPDPGETPALPGVTVHRASGSWSAADLGRLDAELDRFEGPRRLLVQYTPNAWDRRGLNFGFCRWLLARRRRGDEVRIMFHEVRYHMAPRDKQIRRALIVAHTLMARILLRAATHVYVSAPRWAEILRPLAPRRAAPVTWLPVPSNVPDVDDPPGVAEVRRRHAGAGGALIGTFGTFRDTSRDILSAVLPPLLVGHPDRVMLLIGRNGAPFAEQLIADHPALAGRIFATGGLPPGDVSRHLQACDLLVQPDPGGVCAKQGSVMAGLANGRPIVAGAGRITEPVWREEGCVALAPTSDPTELVRIAEECLADPEHRAALGIAARSAYERHFSIARTVARLTGAGVPEDVSA